MLRLALLVEVRNVARHAGHDFSAPFLPAYGSAELEEILRPYADASLDRCFVMTPAGARRAREIGRKVRRQFEATTTVY